MKLFGRRAWHLALAVLACLTLMAPSAAFAGAAENAQLQTYVGTWKGRGVVTGARQETVVCRMTVSKGNQDKVNYSGRCAMAGTTVSVNGTLAYVDAKRRFEAAMTTNAGFTGVAIGVKRGDAVVFNLRELAEDEDGNAVTVNATITLTSAAMGVDFTVTFTK